MNESNRSNSERAKALDPGSRRQQESDLVSIHNRLLFRLFQAGNLLDRQTTKEVGITTVQWSSLGVLARPELAREGIALSDLADYLRVSRQNLDGVLKRLEKLDYVRRVSDERDRRAKRVLLTESGRAFWDGVQPRIHEFLRQSLPTFVLDDEIAMIHGLNKLCDAMSNVKLDSKNLPAAPSITKKN